jgi:hypothetical protein
MNLNTTSSASTGAVANEVQATLFKKANSQQEQVVGKIIEAATEGTSSISNDRSNYETGKTVNVKS